MHRTVPIKLPVISYDGKHWYFDARLREIRGVSNPHDVRLLDDLQTRHFEELVSTRRTVRIVWKDEGRDSEGRSYGPAYTENDAGELVDNYGWITWKEADELATRLGLTLHEV